MRYLRSLGGLALAALSATSAHAEAPPPARTPADPVEALLAQMTLAEKAGQLAQAGAQHTPTGPVVKTTGEADVKRGRVGSLIGVYGAASTRKLQQIAVEQSRLHVPLLFAFDVIHGFRTTFPVPLAEAAAFDPSLAERTARAAAIEATAHGLHWTYAPMVDIARDPRWGRVVEGAGEDPFLGSALAVARTRGLRDPQRARETRLAATAKHFVAYGAAEAGRDYNTVDVSERLLHEIYLPPFRAAVEAGIDTIMPAFNENAGIPMHAHAPLLRELARGRWGFSGVYISDYTGVRELMTHGIAASESEAAARAMAATVDVDMISDIYPNVLPALVESGKLSLQTLDDAVRRVLRLKQQLGLFEDPYRFSDPAREEASKVARVETHRLAREAGQKSIVLLKNERNTLPLKKDLGSIAVIGALAEDAQSQLGAWAGIGDKRDSITILDGIRVAVSPKTIVRYARGASPESDDTRGIDEAAQIAQGADAVVLVLGEKEDMTGEAHCRSEIGLPGAQPALFARMKALGKPLIVLLTNGRPLAIPELAESASALLETWYLGHEMGHAVSDVLFGDVNPSGKLPITFPRTTGQIPIYYNHKNSGRPPSPTERFSSRYLDVPWTPLYPFGHGLSYTSFGYTAPKLSQKTLRVGEQLTVKTTVRNTGKRAGDEVVQLYLRDDVASFTRPVRALRGFQRVTLRPGEAREVTFTLDQDDLALLDDELERVVEPGSFTVYIGGSSEATASASFTVPEGARLAGQGSAIPRMLRTPATTP